MIKLSIFDVWIDL